MKKIYFYRAVIVGVFIFMMNISYLFSQTGANLPVRVMTFCVKNDSSRMNGVDWKGRLENITRLINENNPDLLGLQDVSYEQVTDIAKSLKDYKWFGTGKLDGKQKGEMNPVFYRTDRFEFIEGSTFWLCENPGKPGKGWDALDIRIVTWVKLKEKNSGKIICQYNTRFDSNGVIAQRESAEMILRKIDEISRENCTLITANLNIMENSEVYQIFVSDPVRLYDSKFSIPAGHTGPDYTYTGNPSAQLPGVTLDFILLSGEHFRVLSHRTIAFENEQNGPSDHLPVLCEMELF